MHGLVLAGLCISIFCCYMLVDQCIQPLAGEVTMTWTVLLALGLACVLAIYLIAALLKPEKFS